MPKDQDPAGGLSPDDRGRSTALRALAHDAGNLAARLVFLSANLQPRLTDATVRAETTELLEDSTRRLQEMARKLREMAADV